MLFTLLLISGAAFCWHAYANAQLRAWSRQFAADTLAQLAALTDRTNDFARRLTLHERGFADFSARFDHLEESIERFMHDESHGVHGSGARE